MKAVFGKWVLFYDKLSAKILFGKERKEINGLWKVPY